MNWMYYLEIFFVRMASNLPWIIGVCGGLSIISFGPLGRAMARRLRHGTEDAERSVAVMEELTVIRRELEEVIERQYATERLLTGHRGESLTPTYPTPEDTE